MAEPFAIIWGYSDDTIGQCLYHVPLSENEAAMYAAADSGIIIFFAELSPVEI